MMTAVFTCDICADEFRIDLPPKDGMFKRPDLSMVIECCGKVCTYLTREVVCSACLAAMDSVIDAKLKELFKERK